MILTLIWLSFMPIFFGVYLFNNYHYLIDLKVDESEWKRAWKNKVELSWFNGPHLALNTYLIKFQDKEYPDWLVYGYSVSLIVNPKNWTIEAYHQYYDGDNCHWQFGPFSATRFGTCTGCKKCREE